MFWTSVERAIYRAFFFSYSKKNFLLTFPALVLCGSLVVFCWTFAQSANAWIAMNLIFLPLFLSTALLLALGSMLVKVYYMEVKGLSLNLKRLLSGCTDLMLKTSFLCIPPLLIYLLLWVVLGFFFLLKAIPGVGSFFSVIFSFAPFFLIFGSLLLLLLSLGLLFFVPPLAAFKKLKRIALVKKALETFKQHPLKAIFCLLIALLPTVFLCLLLGISAHFTNISFSLSSNPLALGMSWFFMMIPFAFILSFGVNFFFHFAFESFLLLQSQQQEA